MKTLVKESKEKVIFQSKYLYEKSLEERTRLGYHWYEKHLNPMEVAPPRRSDGFTMCDYCDMQHLPWDKLKEETRQSFIKRVEIFHESEKAYDEKH